MILSFRDSTCAILGIAIEMARPRRPTPEHDHLAGRVSTSAQGSGRLSGSAAISVS